MAQVTEISFNDALAHLQPLLGKGVCVLVNVRDSFSGCVMEGALQRVSTLPPGDETATVHLVIGEDQGIILDPEDVEAIWVTDRRGAEQCLEFHLPSGVAIRLQRASLPASRS